LKRRRQRSLPIAQIAEHDRLHRASLLTGGFYLAVADRAIFFLGIDSSGSDSLDAVRALFHHAAAANGDVGVSQQFKGCGIISLVVDSAS